mmetsp:Transcript_5682/g.7453  ORF Transcript_5682/g.7453 Transcript_5682/m.7453 type:complete len:369 (-) Transcript_5682:3159-4265(-)
MFGSKTKTAQAPPVNNEEQLIKLHSKLIEFYHKHKPENLDNDVLIILMQFYIDNGADRFNAKLRERYGEDLASFVPSNSPGRRKKSSKAKKGTQKVTSVKTAHPSEVAAASSKPKESAKRSRDKHGNKKKIKRSEAAFHRTLPPLPKDPETEESVRDSLRVSKRKSEREIRDSMPARDLRPPKNRGRTDSELSRQATQGKNKSKKKNNAYVDSELKPSDLDSFYAPDLRDEDIDVSEHKLRMLDSPSQQLVSRDLIEAFYSKHDESKLDSYGLIEKFVLYTEQNNLRDLSRKLKAKYGEGVESESIQKLAVRRKNLEVILTKFYLEYDPAKIKTRWAVLKIVTWTMKRGLPKLNGKFEKRYGVPVVPL